MAKKTPAKKFKSEDLMYMGLGIASLAKDKLEDVAEYLAKETGLAKNAKSLQKKLVAEGKKDYAAMMKTMEKGVKKASSRATKVASTQAKKASAKRKK